MSKYYQWVFLHWKIAAHQNRPSKIECLSSKAIKEQRSNYVMKMLNLFPNGLESMMWARGGEEKDHSLIIFLLKIMMWKIQRGLRFFQNRGTSIDNDLSSFFFIIYRVFFWVSCEISYFYKSLRFDKIGSFILP